MAHFHNWLAEHKLAPCPFCGSSKLGLDYRSETMSGSDYEDACYYEPMRDVVYIYCRDCEATGPNHRTPLLGPYDPKNKVGPANLAIADAEFSARLQTEIVAAEAWNKRVEVTP